MHVSVANFGGYGWFIAGIAFADWNVSPVSLLGPTRLLFATDEFCQRFLFLCAYTGDLFDVSDHRAQLHFFH